MPRDPEPAGRFARALLTAVREFVAESLASGDSPQTVGADAMAELPELLELIGLHAVYDEDSEKIRIQFMALVTEAVADAMGGSEPAAAPEAAPEPESSEETCRRLLTFMYSSSLECARKWLKAGVPLRAVVRELTADHPAHIAERVFKIPVDNPHRGDFERAVANLIEDAAWRASQDFRTFSS